MIYTVGEIAEKLNVTASTLSKRISLPPSVSILCVYGQTALNLNLFLGD